MVDPKSQTSNSEPAIPNSQFAVPLSLVFLFFFFSGASGLIYEVIWTRLLLTVFGATIYAVSTVVAAFMGGLALGSYLGGRLADRIRRPLRLYGVLELVVAATALAVPWMLSSFDPVYGAVYRGGSASFFVLSLLRFALTFLVLLIPTTCMGATLPLLSRFLVRRSDALGSRIGGLYTVNTAGALVGTFLAGFVFIAALGVAGTIYLAAAVSGLVGIASLALSMRVERAALAAVPEAAPTEPMPLSPTPPEEDRARIEPRLARLVLATYGISGFVALAYQVFWTRALVFRFEYLKNTTYSFSAMLTVFLTGLFLGGGFMSARIDRERDPVRLYGLIQILIGLSGAFSLFVLIRYAGLIGFGEALDPDTFAFNWRLATANVFVRTVATIGLPTFLMGMAFPVAARICIVHLRRVGAGTGRLYAVNTVGAILGSFCAGFLLIPVFGLGRGLLVLGLTNVALGVIVLVARSRGDSRSRLAWSVLGTAILVVFLAAFPRDYYFQDLSREFHHKIVAYEEGPLATVSVVENSIGYRTLYVDNVGVAGTDRILLTDQKSLAHVPMLFLENPKSALTVGFGSGGASYSYTLYPELERIDCIEISKTVPKMAGFLKDSNHGMLDEPRDPRFRLIFDDARSYLRFTDTRYDIIATDCTDLRYKSNANLYDVEYFDLCRRSITDDGMVVVWMPLGGMSPEVFACALKTFAHVFPDMTIWYMNNEPTHYLLLIGTNEPLRIDLDRLIERTSRPEIRRDLAEVSLHQPEKILSCFLTSAPALEADFARAPLNTENSPHLEFESPKYGYTDEALLVNIDLLRSRRENVSRYLDGGAKHPDFLVELAKFEKAVDPILTGHQHLRRLELVEACRSYLEAAAICPRDESVSYLLGFDDLERRFKKYGNLGDLWPVLTLGEIDLVKGDPARAAARFSFARRVSRERGKEGPEVRKQVAMGLARALDGLGRVEDAVRELDSEKAASFAADADFRELRERLDGHRMEK